MPTYSPNDWLRKGIAFARRTSLPDVGFARRLYVRAAMAELVDAQR